MIHRDLFIEMQLNPRLAQRRHICVSLLIFHQISIYELFFTSVWGRMRRSFKIQPWLFLAALAALCPPLLFIHDTELHNLCQHSLHYLCRHSLHKLCQLYQTIPKPTETPNFRISTKFQNLDQISEFWPNFRISSKFPNLKPNFRISSKFQNLD